MRTYFHTNRKIRKIFLVLSQFVFCKILCVININLMYNFNRTTKDNVGIETQTKFNFNSISNSIQFPVNTISKNANQAVRRRFRCYILFSILNGLEIYSVVFSLLLFKQEQHIIFKILSSF